MVDLAATATTAVVADFDVRSRVPILLNPRSLTLPSRARAARGDDARVERERDGAPRADEATRVSSSAELEVFRGTKMIVEHALLDQPVALAALHTDEARRAPPSAAPGPGARPPSR